MKRRVKGFTLVELTVVVGLITVLAGVSIPNVLRGRIAANEASAQSALKTISVALENYLIANQTYPVDTDLLLSDSPPYLNTDFFNGTIHNGYSFTASTLTLDAYSITAAPLTSNNGSVSYTITTGGVLTENP